MPQSTLVSSQGARLRDERERIGLSQKDLASHLGLHRNTIVRWEQIDFSPTNGILDALRALGMDADYIALGDHIPTSDHYGLAAIRVLSELANRIGICFEALQMTIELQAEYNRALSFGGQCQDLTDEALGALLDLLMDNSALLAEVFHGVADAQQALGVSLSLTKRVQSVMMLCRTFNTTGKVEQKVVEDVVALAGS